MITRPSGIVQIRKSPSCQAASGILVANWLSSARLCPYPFLVSLEVKETKARKWRVENIKNGPLHFQPSIFLPHNLGLQINVVHPGLSCSSQSSRFGGNARADRGQRKKGE
jgi:hypothetical protein